jgi:sugar phosphate permease
MTPGAAPSRVFYGWRVALALSIIVFLSAGIRFTIGPFLKPVSAELGLDRGSFSLVISAPLFLYGAFMPLVGRLVDRLGSRIVCTTGAVVMAASLVLAGRMTTLWEFYLYYAVIGSLGLAATGHVMGSVALARWFVPHRGVAMSSLGSASMAGMAVLVPAAMWCILRFGWRTSFVILGVASLCIMLPLTLWVLHDDPESMGLEPAAHGVPMLTDHGFHPMTASSAIGFLGMTAIGGGIMLGLISDRWGASRCWHRRTCCGSSPSACCSSSRIRCCSWSWPPSAGWACRAASP